MNQFLAREKQRDLYLRKYSLNNPYDSEDEYYMDCWMQEALDKGIISSYTFHPESFSLYNAVTRSAGKQTEETLFRELIYTADFQCTFTELGRGILFDNIEGEKKMSQVEFLAHSNYLGKENFAVIDVKPSYSDRYGSSRDFRYIQRLMWDRYGLYVNKTVILDPRKNKFFAWTFVPRKYLLRAKKNGSGFLKVNVKTEKIVTSEQYTELLLHGKESNKPKKKKNGKTTV